MSSLLLRAVMCFGLVCFAESAAAQPPKKPAAKRPARPVAKAPVTPVPDAPPPAPDLVMTSRYVVGDKTTTNTVTLHGARERIDYETALATIQQCDTARTIELNSKTRTYLLYAFVADVTPPAAAPTEKRKGGEITYTTVVTDTGERKDLLGFKARHLKTVVTKTWTPDAWDKTPERVETDGWYIDLPATTTCMGAPQSATTVRVNPQDVSARDVVHFVRPDGSTPFPLAYSLVTTAAGDAGLTTTMEVTDLKRVVADAALFDVPTGYLEVKTPAQLTADHRPDEDGPKKPGTIRIGVAPVVNRSGETLPADDLSEALVESLGAVQKDVVMLRASSPKEIEAEAQRRQCDYIFQNTVSQVKKNTGGMLGKISGASADEYAAKVDFALVAPGQPKPAISGTEHTGTSMLRKGISAAGRVTELIAPFMLGTGYMNAFGAMSGKASPLAMQQTQDPVLSSVFSLVDRATAPKPEPMLTTRDGAVALALQHAVDTVTSGLKKRGGS